MNSFRLVGEVLRATVESTSASGLRSAVVELLLRHFPHARVAWLNQNGSQWGLAGATAALARVPIDRRHRRATADRLLANSIGARLR